MLLKFGIVNFYDYGVVGDAQVSKIAYDQGVLDADVGVVGAIPRMSHRPIVATYDFVFDARVSDTGEAVRLTIGIEVQVVANPGYPINLEVTAKQVMDALVVSKDERQKYRDVL